MPRERGMPGMYANAVPLGAYGSPYTRPLMSGQQQIPKLLSNLRPQESWRGPTPLFQQAPQRTAGAAPLLAWNRMLPAQSQYPPGQYQGLGGPMNYPQRPEDRMDRGRQVWKCCLHIFSVRGCRGWAFLCCFSAGACATSASTDK
ncbi:5'-3' exoribonuclease 2-like [Meleagris gallopavo]|uniref:5'-3' exoribonuclease 2-like n=1 Tax=Meleagris gallopavo TaxID=9103 RepID=UPI000549A89A|nr:5'-3' exoribonuclease 2-like [Meleagris gallopavo]